MDPITVSILTQHLPYELDTFEQSYVFLHSDEYAELRRRPFLKNAAIEVFWLHARNLMEFLTHLKNPTPQGAVSARDFSPDYQPDLKMKSMDQRINAAVSHLLYERKTTPEDKLGGYDMLRVKECIDREIEQFEKAMLEEYRAIWTKRNPTKWIPVMDQVTSTSSHTASVFGGLNISPEN
jgi:hypothetical protein